MSQFSGNSEFALIDWIRQRVPSPASRLRVGIGDDAAELDLADTDGTLLAVDMLVEGIHFTFPNATPRQVGHKALAVNLSDIAAMGGVVAGDAKRYQIWYRDPNTSPCGAQFNLSNGMEITWSA